MTDDMPGPWDGRDLRELLDGPVGPTARLAPAARRIARRRTARRRAGLTAAAAAAAAAAVAVPSLDAGTESLAPEFAGPGGVPAGAAQTARALGMDAAFGDDHGRIAAECVRAAGIDHSIPGAEAGGASAPSSPWLAPTGAGYGPAKQTANPGGPVPAGWEEAMYGSTREEVMIPIGNGGYSLALVSGCHGQATEALYGVPAEQYERVYQQVRPVAGKAIEAAVRDDAVQDAAGRWSDCMADAGWDVQTPDGLDNALAPELAAADSSEAARVDLARREGALGAADADCRATSGLQEAFDRAFIEHGARAAQENGTALRAYRQMLDHAAAMTGG